MSCSTLPIISSLHCLTFDSSSISHAKQAENICKGGGNWIQFRSKEKKNSLKQKWANEVLEVCRHYNTTLIINDDVLLAKKIQAHGVHLGTNDIPIQQAKKILPKHCIIGGTAHNLKEAKYQLSQEVHYIGLGPYRYSSTKNHHASILTQEHIKQITAIQFSVPIILIGGIQLNDISSLLSLSGIHGVAICSALHQTVNPIDSTQKFCQTIKQFTSF